MGIDTLTAEVVDDQGAAIGFHLERRFIEAHGWAIDQIHGFDGHLTANDDDGTLDSNPALVVTADAIDRHRVMIMEIENFDHMSLIHISEPTRLLSISY